MTLDEKLGQMVSGRFLMDNDGAELNATRVNYFVNKYKIGSLLNDPHFGRGIPSPLSDKWASITNQLQSAYQATPLKIPMVYGLDSIHGANPIRDATLFPHQLALAAAFNRSLAREVAGVAAKDTRAVGVHWNFSPSLDVGVNKKWSRLYETFGEDPFLAGEMGVETIIGYQGTSLRANNTVAATLKHFFGYSASNSGMAIDGVWMHERVLNDYFRLPFQRAVYADAACIMSSYSDLNGEHTATSKKYLVDLLRREMEFKGALVTDFGQINNSVTGSLKEALYISISLGTIDFNMNGVGIHPTHQGACQRGRHPRVHH
ncbi:hypothetical protein DSO57_1007628 [Entomophthora muscae]|uniref:Uncharacterized protein n=1 Tax=Entomophthora muscae TaxID=34485 RepID=A0ACC2TVU1_9FUNG|nr:hypothetical protein DSO57_1007628 [Entomophthora muscae]